MQRRIQSIIAGAIVLLFGSVVIYSCNKLDTTNIGGDLIPVVDNVTTFADTLPIITTQGVFNDTSVVARTDDHVIGNITNDPLFGTTAAAAYFELKPGFYPYYIGNAGDTINPALVSGTRFDSVVLVLNYKGFYGDTMLPVQFQVFQVSAGNPKWDSTYAVRNVNYAPTTSTLLGTSPSIDVRTLPNYFHYANNRDTANNQIRIKLSTAFMNSLVSQDTLVVGSSNNGFRSDSLFKNYFRGFAVKAIAGNGLVYSNLADTNTKLEIHYVRRHGLGLDTAYSSFKLNSSSLGTVDNAPSITVDNIKRNRGGSESAIPSTDALYIQTAPGTYANLSIPGLTGLSNRIVHRAEITIQQIPSSNPALDGLLAGPPYMYMDLIDTTSTPRWKPIYYDLDNNSTYDPDYSTSTIYFPSGGVNHTNFGGYLRYKTNSFGANAAYYTFNITRYVQQIATKGTKNFNLRLWAPYDIIYPQYTATVIPYSNPIANGRIKIGSGTNPNVNYRMMLRLVYSKI